MITYLAPNVVARWRRLLACLVPLLLLGACARAPTVYEATGQTMGTFYSVVVVEHPGVPAPADLKALVEDALVPVNERLSNWSPTSEVSRFNAHQGTDPVPISRELREVMAVAGEVHARSSGQFDVTLAPLIELWGFGAQGPGPGQVPTHGQIQEALGAVGQERWLELSIDGSTLRKRRVDTTVYLAALAKGYGIDAVAEALRTAGWGDFMVEIGGDLYAAGTNGVGQAWRIGVERPDAVRRTVYQIVEASDLAMATSGDYRNYFEDNGVRYSHIIDAQTGRPVTHRTASVTVLAATATRADAWATALLALGRERGLPVADRWGLAALFITREEGSGEPAFVASFSKRFAELRADAEDRSR